jgi:NAD(P)-dependent dehydrogenase (short-subunit alcohol dehydrogenase family)
MSKIHRRDFLAGGVALTAISSGGQIMGETIAGQAGCLQGKLAAVTGAARGIGRAVAVAFANQGADVIGIDICAPVYPPSGVTPARKEDLDETGRQVEATGRRWLGLVVDQRDMPALRAAAARIEREIHGIDILFANAGIQAFKSLLEMDDADWQVQIENNLTGTANAIRAFGPQLVKRRGGRIIVTSSTQGRHGMKDGASYSVSKWGIIGLMKSAALEFAPYGVTVNALIPGLIDTPLTRHEERYAQAIEEAGQAPTGTPADEQKARQILLGKTPLKVPWIEPGDVAPVVVFLASEAARMVTGSTYDVTGGDSAHNAT